jgi:ABC-type glycerol-3-phosphate transport system permease component
MNKTLKAVSAEAKLLLIGIPVFLWTMIPVYHMFLFAISSKDSATSGRLWPKEPTLKNFETVFTLLSQSFLAATRQLFRHCALGGIYYTVCLNVGGFRH